jgi:hypothetical protein
MDCQRSEAILNSATDDRYGLHYSHRDKYLITLVVKSPKLTTSQTVPYSNRLARYSIA